MYKRQAEGGVAGSVGNLQRQPGGEQLERKQFSGGFLWINLSLIHILIFAGRQSQFKSAILILSLIHIYYQEELPG